jgi:hypothetical protein
MITTTTHPLIKPTWLGVLGWVPRCGHDLHACRCQSLRSTPSDASGAARDQDHLARQVLLRMQLTLALTVVSTWEESHGRGYLPRLSIWALNQTSALADGLLSPFLNVVHARGTPPQCCTMHRRSSAWPVKQHGGYRLSAAAASAYLALCTGAVCSGVGVAPQAAGKGACVSRHWEDCSHIQYAASGITCMRMASCSTPLDKCRV